MSDQKFTVSAGFFDSVGDDRLYSADDMNKPYSRLIPDGVYALSDGLPSNDFKVESAGDGLKIKVNQGQAMVGSKWFNLLEDQIITVQENTSGSPRIDSIILQLDKSLAVRAGSVVYRTGTAASSPSAPDLVSTALITEIRLANIAVASGLVTVTDSLITDLRGTDDCPWITSILQESDYYDLNVRPMISIGETSTSAGTSVKDVTVNDSQFGRNNDYLVIKFTNGNTASQILVDISGFGRSRCMFNGGTAAPQLDAGATLMFHMTDISGTDPAPYYRLDFVGYYPKGKFNEIDTEIADLKNDLCFINNGGYIFGIVPNVYIDRATGEELPYTGWNATDYIPVPAHYVISVTVPTSLPYGAIYNSQKEFVIEKPWETGTSVYKNESDDLIYVRTSGNAANISATSVTITPDIELQNKLLNQTINAISEKFTGYLAKTGGSISAYPTRVTLEKTQVTQDCTVLFNDLLDDSYGTGYDVWYEIYASDGTTLVKTSGAWVSYKDIVSINVSAEQWVYITSKYSPVEVDTSSVAAINNIANSISIVYKTVSNYPDTDFIISNRDLQNNDTIMFTWASDTHHQVRPDGGTKYGLPIEKFTEMSEVSEALKTDFVVLTGDIVNGYYPVAEQKMNIINVVNALRGKCEMPVMMVEGNHDDNSWYASASGSGGTVPTGLAEVLTNDQFTNYSMNNSIDDYVFNASDPLSGYYYKDFEKAKIRAIVLNVEDVPYIEKSDLTLEYYGQWTMALRQNQLSWLANSALQFDKSGWGVIIFLHNDSNMTGNTSNVVNMNLLNQILTAFSEKTNGTAAGTITDFEVSVSYDFRQNQSDDVIAWFSGHWHDDSDEIIDGVPHVRLINTANTSGGGYDIVTVDRQARKIYTKRYNGVPMPSYNRTISF